MATPEFDDMVKMLTDILNEREFSGPPEWKATWDTLVAEIDAMPEGAVVDIPNEIPLVEPPEGGWTPREPVAPAAPEGNADTPVAAANLRGGNFSYQLPSNPAGPVHMIQWGTPEGSWVSRAKTFDRNSDAVIVSLEPTPLEKSALAVGDGAAADGLHVTLCKLGTVQSLGDEGRRLIGSVCALLGAEYRPIEASIGGIGWFGAADASTVALVNGAELPALRHAVCSALAEAGFPAVDDLGFMPHVTLADGPVDAASVVGQSLTFNELRVRWGNEVLAFDLIGIAKPPVAPEPILEIAPEAPLTSAERLEAALEVFGGPGSGPHKQGDSGGESPKQGTLPGTEQKPSKPSIGDRLRGLVGKDPKGALPDGPAPGYGTVTPMKWTENTQGPETGHDPKYDGPSYTGVGSVTNATGAEQETRNVISSNPEQTEFTYDVSIHIADDPGGVREIPAGTDTGTAPSLDEAKAAGDALIEAAAADHVAAVDQAVAEAAPSGQPAMPDPGNWYFTGERWTFTAEEMPSETPPVDITSIPDDALAIELGRRAAVQAVEALEADGGEVSASAKAMIEENALDAVDSALSAAIQGLAATEVATDEIPAEVADVAEATDPVERDAVTAAAIRARLRARRAAREEAFNGDDSPVVVIEVEVEGREDDDEGDDDGMEMCDECGAVMEPMDGHCSECGAMIVPPMGEMMASTPDRPYEWEGVLTVEGVPSGDNRMISEGSLTWRELPVPLMLQTVNAPGHEGAVICGSIVEVERDGKSIVGRGYFSANDAGGAARQLLDEKSMRGISVDIDSVQMVFADPAGVELSRDQAMEAHAFGDGEVLELIVSGRVMGATLTPFPAFQEAHVYLLGPTENAPEALVASASGPIYRSTRPADVVLAGDDMLGALVASAGGAAAAPPAAWFQLQPMDVPVPFTVSADGRCYGLLAQFGTCHIGNSGVCVEVPQSNDFRSFYTGKTVLTAEGTSLSVGPIIMDTVHPNLRMQASDAQAFYAHTGCAVADVRLYTNDHGIVAAGCVRPEVDELTVRRFRASDISPDWRPIGGQRRLVSLLAVNTSGFLVEGIAASAGRFQPWGLVDLATGELGALVAAGAIHNPDRRTVGDELAEMQARLAQQDSMISVLMAPHVAADRRARTSVAMSALGLDCGCGCGGASGASCSTERDARLAAALGLLDGPRRGAAVPVG